MTCPACGGTSSSSEFTVNGIVLRCLNSECGCKYPQPDDQADEFEDRDEDEQEERVVAPKPPPKRIEPVQEQPKRKPLTIPSIVQQARAELRILNAEIKRLEKLKIQRDEVIRLLDAAKKPDVDGLAKVRPIRTQTGR